MTAIIKNYIHRWVFGAMQETLKRDYGLNDYSDEAKLQLINEIYNRITQKTFNESMHKGHFGT